MGILRVNFYIFVFGILFCLSFYDFINGITSFSYTDEIFCIILGYYWLVNRKLTIRKEFFVFVAVSFVYFFYSIYLSLNVLSAVVTDFFIQIKPFVIYYLCKDVDFYILENDRKRIKKVCLILFLSLLPIGIIYLHSDSYMQTFFGHPSRFGSFMSLIGMVYFWSSQKTKKDLVISMIMVTSSALSLRSKSFGFIVIYIGIMFLITKSHKDIKLISTKKILSGLLILALAIYAGWEKFQFYFVTGTQNENMFARPALYLGAIDILHDYPILGTGFGTYATHASALYYSPIYYKYSLNQIEGLEEGGQFISDTFFPEFAQFGVFGIFLFFYFWKKRIEELRAQYKKNENDYDITLCVLIVTYLMVESIADSTFTQNRGLFAMMFLCVIQNTIIHERKKLGRSYFNVNC